MSDPAAVSTLKAARALVEEGWVQRSFVKSRVEVTGHWWNRKRTTHTSFCMIGALNHYERPAKYRAMDYLAMGAGVSRSMLIPTWNDKEGRTKEEVLAAFDKAISLAESDEADNLSPYDYYNNHHRLNTRKNKYFQFDDPPVAKFIHKMPQIQIIKEPEPVKLNVVDDVKEYVNSLPEPKYTWYDPEIKKQIREAVGETV